LQILVPIGQPGILYNNVEDKGEVIPDTKTDFEKLQKTISSVINQAWPPIYFTPRILESDGQKFVTVVVFGSPLRPHFAGRAYVRVGPESRDATEEQYDDLIAQRSSKYRRLKRLEGKSFPGVLRIVGVAVTAPASLKSIPST
jgi:predicted HTH transcriptional regulator